MGDVALKERMNTEAKAWGARPTVLWNIMIGDDYKILQLGSNHHLELLKKVNFWWKEKRINLTSPIQNYLMYCERTGQKSTTRYTFEVIDSIQPISLQVPPAMKELTKVYEPLKLEEMFEIANSGFAPSYPNAKQKADPNAPLEEYRGPMIGHLNQFHGGGQQQPSHQENPFQQTNMPPQQHFTPPPAQAPYTPPVQPQAPYIPPTQPQHPHANPGSHFHTPPPATSQPAQAPYTPPQAAPAYVPPAQQPQPQVPPTQAAPQAPVHHAPPLAQPTAAAPTPPTAPVNQAQETEIASMLAALNQGKN